MSRAAAKAATVDDLLAALADPARRRAVEILGQGPRRAGELANLLDLDPPAMSRHLRILRQSGLVAETHPEFDQRVRIYALDAARLTELKDWLARAEAGWTTQLAAFRAHVVAKAKTAPPAQRRGRKA
jgi:DNA-binding transcriptional ArsR family regulator